MRCARVALSKYLNPVNPFGAIEALDQIIDVIDSDEVDPALSRIDARNHLGSWSLDTPTKQGDD